MVTQGKRPLSPELERDRANGLKPETTKDEHDEDGGQVTKRARHVEPELEQERKPEVVPISTPRKPMNAMPPPKLHLRPCRQVFIFGNGNMNQLGLGTTVTGEITRPRLHAWFESASEGGILGEEEGAGVEVVYAGGMHTLAIDELGRVWSWGVNDAGALGRPTVDVPDPDRPDQLIPSEMLESQPMLVQTLVEEGFRAVRVAAGDSVSVVLGENGQLRVWGSFRASDGLLGFSRSDEKPTPQFRPTALPLLETLTFAQVACGSDHVIALTTQGTVYVWGNGQQAQLGRKIIERRKVNGLAPERLALRRIKYIAAGSYHSFAVTEHGVVYAWGLNNLRQTGVDEDMVGADDIVWTPTEVTALNPSNLGGRKVVQISGGEHHTLFLLNDGSVYGCGRCDGSELGLASDHPSMAALTDTSATNTPTDDPVAAAPQHTHASYISTPIHIPFPPPPTPTDPSPPLPPFAHLNPPHNPIVRICAGTRHNLAVSRFGHAYSWGEGQVGQLGQGADVEVQGTPARVRSRVMDELRGGGGEGYVWKVEDVCAGGQHCVLVAKRIE